MAEYYAAHPDDAVDMINALLADAEAIDWFVVLRQLRKAFCGDETLPRVSEMSEAECATALEAHRDPPLSAIASIVKGMGMKLAVVPAKAEIQVEESVHERALA